MGLRSTVRSIDLHLGEIQTLPGGQVQAKATHEADGKVYGQAMWPGHPDPVRFWTTVLVWDRLCRGKISERAFGKPAPKLSV